MWRDYFHRKSKFMGQHNIHTHSVHPLLSTVYMCWERDKWQRTRCSCTDSVRTIVTMVFTYMAALHLMAAALFKDQTLTFTEEDELTVAVVINLFLAYEKIYWGHPFNLRSMCFMRLYIFTAERKTLSFYTSWILFHRRIHFPGLTFNLHHLNHLHYI